MNYAINNEKYIFDLRHVIDKYQKEENEWFNYL